MVKREKISIRQLNSILFNMMMIVSVLVPLALVEAKRDAWLGSIAINLGKHLLMAVALLLVFRFPGRTLGEICRLVLGRVGGTLLLIIYTCFFLYDTAAILRSFSEFLIIAIMPQTPISVVVLSLGLLAAYGVRHGVETLGRYSLVILPIILGGIVLSVSLVARVAQPERLLPILEEGPMGVLRAFWSTPSIFTEVVFLPTLASMLADRRALRRSLHAMLLNMGALITVVYVVVIGVLGDQIATTTLFPVYALVRYVNVGEFIQRVEPLFMTVVVMGYFLRAAFELYAFSYTAAELLGLADYRPLVLPLIPGTMALAIMMTANESSFRQDVVGVLVPLTWVMSLPVPLGILLVDALRHWFRPRSNPVSGGK